MVVESHCSSQESRDRGFVSVDRRSSELSFDVCACTSARLASCLLWEACVYPARFIPEGFTGFDDITNGIFKFLISSIWEYSSFLYISFAFCNFAETHFGSDSFILSFSLLIIRSPANKDCSFLYQFVCFSYLFLALWRWLGVPAQC